MLTHAAEPRPVAQHPGHGRSARLRRGLAEVRRDASRLADPVRVLHPRTSAASTPGCSSRRGPAARPTASTVDSFQLALFIENGVLQPLDAYFSQGGDRRPLPVHPRGHHRTGRPHLCLVVGHRPARALSQQGPRADGAADLGRAQGGGARGGRRTASKACCSMADAGRAPPSTGWPTSGPGRRARRRQRQADLRRGRESREDAEGAQLLQGSGRQRRRTEARGDDQRLRRLQRRGASPAPTAMFVGGHWQHFQLQEAMPPDAVRQMGGRRAARADAGPARDRHRRLDGRRVHQGSGEDRDLRGRSCARSTWARRTR